MGPGTQRPGSPEGGTGPRPVPGSGRGDGVPVELALDHPYRGFVTVFIDRDGVINENRADHVKAWAEFRFIPGAREELSALETARDAIEQAWKPAVQ